VRVLEQFMRHHVLRCILNLGGLCLAGCPAADDPAASPAPSPPASDASQPPIGTPDAGGAEGGVADGASSLAGPSWYQDVAPLLAHKCGACHQDDGIAPFSVQSYERAKPFAALMADAVESGRMPPFLARETADCKPPLPWANDPRLSDSEKKLLRAWVERGAPAGEPGNAAPAELPTIPSLARADLTVKLPSAIQVAGRDDIHTCIILDPQLDRDRYVVGTQITPGNKKVLHHAVSYLLLPGQTPGLFGLGAVPRSKAELVAAIKQERGVGIGERYECRAGLGLQTVPTETLDVWAPGGLPRVLPSDTGMFVPKDALLMINLHYHPLASTELDESTQLALQFAEQKPLKVAQMLQVGNFDTDNLFWPDRLLPQPGEPAAVFRIPAGENKHVEEMTRVWQLPQPARVYSLFTHMHYVGRDMRVSLERQNSSNVCLVQTPAWDFNWQLVYDYAGSYEELPEIRSGDLMRMHCEYDNTLANPFLRTELGKRGMSSPAEVVLGEDTDDEMCITFVGITYPNPL
jgi:hypothetical protein